MKDLLGILNFLSAICAFSAAMCWLKVALVSLPATMGLTVDMTNFDWLTKPVLEQANWNKRAAYFAVAAAVLQGLVAASDLV